jgi:enoyl-[acyl-carrier-protein] reductase (NADH)
MGHMAAELTSDLSRKLTCNVAYVDGGFHLRA